MQAGKFNAVLDAYWGSSGKGKVCAWLAKRYGATDLSSSNGPNAGHTVEQNGNRYVFKQLPSASIAKLDAQTWIGPSAVIDRSKLQMEIDRNKKLGEHAFPIVHPHAVEVKAEHAASETALASLTAIGSTAQGTMAAKLAKLLRERDGVVNGTMGGITHQTEDPDSFYQVVQSSMRCGKWLHEVSQGYMLSVDHGQYPYVTSKNCTVQNAMDDFQIAPSEMGDVYLVVRSFPIRVGNGGGFSGPFEPMCTETSWDQIIQNAGMTSEQEALCRQYEITTVTKRVRRVAEIRDFAHLGRIARSQGATKIVLQFANYIDARAWGVRDAWKLPSKVWHFIDKIESHANAKVVLVGTGADTDDMVEV